LAPLQINYQKYTMTQVLSTKEFETAHFGLKFLMDSLWCLIKLISQNLWITYELVFNGSFVVVDISKFMDYLIDQLIIDSKLHSSELQSIL